MDRTLSRGKNEGSKEVKKLIFKKKDKSLSNHNYSKSNNIKLINKKMENKREEILNTLKMPYVFFRKPDLPSVNYTNNSNSINPLINAGLKNSYNIQNLEPRDKEALIVELYHVTNDMDMQSKELEDLKKDYSNLVNNSLTYKIIIERILKIDQSGYSTTDNKEESESKKREKCKSENNFKSANNTIDEHDEIAKHAKSKKHKLSTIKKNKNKVNNTFYSSALKTNNGKFIIKNNNLNDKENNAFKISVLKKQRNYYNKLLNEKERNLIKIKLNEKNKKFDELVTLLNSKNNVLEELVGETKRLQYEKFESESIIQFYLSKIGKFTDDISTIGEKLKINQKELNNTIQEIDNLIKYKQELKQKEVKLTEDEQQKEFNIKEKKEFELKIDSLLKEKKNYFNERTKLDAQVLELKKQEEALKKLVDKNKRMINGLKKENDHISQEITLYEEGRKKLLEKADQPRKNRLKMKEMENEINDLEKKIISYKVENDEKEKNMEETENKNNEEITQQEEEIKKHANIVSDLTKQIADLKMELKKKEENNQKKNEELLNQEKEYDKKVEQAKLDKENLEKEKKEKELKENDEEMLKNKENEEKDSAFLKSKKELAEEVEKLKAENNKIKEERNNLEKSHKEKMGLYKAAEEKRLKLKKILDDIKQLTDKS